MDKEKWLKPKLFVYDETNYYISGNVDNLDGNIATELKTTWVTAKYKINQVVQRARTQADIYGWMDNSITKINIEVVNLAKPELNYVESYAPEVGHVPEILHNYIASNKHLIKGY